MYQYFCLTCQYQRDGLLAHTDYDWTCPRCGSVHIAYLEVGRSKKTAAGGMDDWKLPIFKKHLDAAGYTYEKPVPFTAGTLILKVHYEWVHQLQPILEAAQQECNKLRRLLRP